MRKRVALYTLGCKLNQADTEAIRQSFEDAGYETVDFQADADVYVVNTCTVTGNTDHQARQMLRRAVRKKDALPGAKVVAAGCYSQTRPGELIESVEGLDLVVGNLDKERIPELLARESMGCAAGAVRDVFEEREFRPMKIDAFADYSRAFLRIQEGCNCRCAYCIVPFARGRSRSAKLEDAELQARKFADAGYKEIVLAGIHIGKYGLDLSPKQSLATLLRRLNDIDGLERIRLSSIDPGEFTDELFDALDATRGKLCPHFHISLQSGDDKILKRMRRDYTSSDFEAIATRLRELFPDVAIGADVIVGFPGEDFEAFDNTVAVVERTRLSFMHIFRYSKRPGTAAAEMEDQTRDDVKILRSKKLHEIKFRLENEYMESFVGREVEAMLESRRLRGGMLTGLTRQYIRVFANGDDALMGKLVMARVASVEDGGLIADGVRLAQEE